MHLYECEQLNHGISGRTGIITIAQFQSVFNKKAKEKTNSVKMIENIFPPLILLLKVKIVYWAGDKKISVSGDK